MSVLSPETKLALEQYYAVVGKGQVAVNVLERLVQHDQQHLNGDDSGAFARRTVLGWVQQGKIAGAKAVAERGDWGYGEQWPLPPDFSLSVKKERDSQIAAFRPTGTVRTHARYISGFV